MTLAANDVIESQVSCYIDRAANKSQLKNLLISCKKVANKMLAAIKEIVKNHLQGILGQKVNSSIN